MPTVRPFDRSMIEQSLRSQQLKYLRDSDGDFRVEFGYDEETDCEVTFSLMATGPREIVYCILVFSNKRIPSYEWDRAIKICNQWNEEKRWPKAYLHINGNVGGVILEHQMDFEAGVHQELLDDFTRSGIIAGIEFWKWAHQEKAL